MRVTSIEITECGKECPYFTISVFDEAEGRCRHKTQIDMHTGRSRPIYIADFLKGFPKWCELEVCENDQLAGLKQSG